MNKQITPDQALALSFTPFRYSSPVRDSKGKLLKDDKGEQRYELVDVQRFIKPGETQANAMKRLRANSLGRTKQGPVVRKIPSFTPGLTTTAQYVASFEAMNNLVPTNSAKHLTRPASILLGPEVEVIVDEQVDDLVADLV